VPNRIREHAAAQKRPGTAAAPSPTHRYARRVQRIAVLTSGGDAPGMNSAIWAVMKLAASRGIDVVGVQRGYDGLMDGDFRPLTRSTSTGDRAPVAGIDWLAGTGGTFLGSSRSPRFETTAGRAEASRQLESSGIEGLIVIGGNGSLTGAHLLAGEGPTPIVGIPASIDNDVGGTTAAIGVDTALNTIINAIDNIADTARSHRRAFILEVMGRRSGYLAMAAAAAASADGALIPEDLKSEVELLDGLEALVRDSFAAERSKQRVIIIKAEGVDVPCTRLARLLGDRIEDLQGVDVRAAVLGHIVRGGRPTYRDRIVAGRLALGAMVALLQGRSDVMAAWNAGTGTATPDGNVTLIDLEYMLAETAAMLDGSSELVRRRIRLMQEVQGVLAL
jgi:6-phosphofructokinase 1